MSKGRNLDAPGIGASAFSPTRSPPQHICGRSGGQSDSGKGYRITAGTPTPLTSGLGGCSSFGSIYLSGDEFETQREIKNHFPRAEEMANYRERLLTDSPTGPSFSTARRERSLFRGPISATLEKPLTREFLVYPA